MARAQWLQDRRMQMFRDVLSRWERRELSAMDAGEILGGVGAAISALPAALRGRRATRAAGQAPGSAPMLCAPSGLAADDEESHHGEGQL